MEVRFYQEELEYSCKMGYFLFFQIFGDRLVWIIAKTYTTSFSMIKNNP